MITTSRLWDAQDALLTALQAQAALTGVAVDLGFPGIIKPDHVFIMGQASGQQQHEVTSATPSDETFRMEVVVYTRLAANYAAIRDRLKTFTAAVESALASATFTAVVPAWDITEYELAEGFNEDGRSRETSLTITVECRCW